MLNVQLANAGFYEISWPTDQVEGVTFVRPGSRELVRVFVPRHSTEVEVYAGSLKQSRLVYQGPAEEVAQLALLAQRSN